MNTIIHRLDDGSGVVILPRQMLDGLGLQVGDELQIIETDGGIILRPVESDDVERQMRAARDVMDKYAPALQKLAERIG
jgi:putative addiction module antidote